MSDLGQSVGNGPAWLDDPLTFLLRDVAPDGFFRDHYEKSLLHVPGNDEARFAGLLSVAEIDALVDGADLRAGMVDLVRSSGRIGADRYVGTDGRIIPSAVASEYLNGATIILPQLHESMPKLGRFCRALEAALSCEVQTNVYLTPPGSQGFAAHFDHHDVFVLQVSGSKNWRIYGTPVALPYRGEGFVPGGHEPGLLSESLTLAPGDCLYLPRGVMHDAPNAGDEPSLHITVGLITKTWADLMLSAVSALTLREPAFRNALPFGFGRAGFDRGPARARFEKLKRLIAESAELDSALDLIAHEFLRDRRPQVSGVISGGPDDYLAGGQFRRRSLVPFQLNDLGGKPTVVGPGGDLSFDAGDGAALHLALSGSPFRLADLACPDPTRVLRRLWANGYLERVATDT